MQRDRQKGLERREKLNRRVEINAGIKGFV